MCLPNAKTAQEISKNPSKCLCAIGYFGFNALIDMNPGGGSLYIHSASEPYSEEQVLSQERVDNWLGKFGIDRHQIHGSGHAKGQDLFEIVKKIDAKCFFQFILSILSYTSGRFNASRVGVNIKLGIIKNIREGGNGLEDINEKIEQLNEVDRFILLLLRAGQSRPVPGALWLQKEMFLLQNAFPKLGEETDYEPYLMGPHSEIVSDEAEELHKSRLIKVEGGRISLTPAGKVVSEILARKSDKQEVEKTEEFKEFLNDLTKDELLAFIYFSYPMPQDIAKESVEYKDLLPKRRKLAFSLHEKGKISAQKAAQIAGINLEEFIKEVKMVA